MKHLLSPSLAWSVARGPRPLVRGLSPALLKLPALALIAILLGASTAGAAIAVRATGTAATTTGTSLSIAVPSGVQVGDLLIANISDYNSSAGSVGAPSGSTWTSMPAGTLSSATTYGALFYRVATSADTSTPSYTFTVASGNAVGIIVAFSGVDTSSSPFDVTPGSLTTGTGSSPTATAVTTASANAAVIMFGMNSRSSSGTSLRTGRAGLQALLVH